MEKVKKMEYPNLVVENAPIREDYVDIAKQLARDTIFEFLELCKVPRPSKHMEKVRAYLMQWAEDHDNLDFDARIDDSGCVIIDVPASAGENEDGVAYADYPNVILQSHMDMVASAVKDYRHCNYKGQRWEPRDDSIPAVYDREKGIISTEGKCSLGADDGQGIAISLAIAKNTQLKHGPLRLLFTYDEETDMQGARQLDIEKLNAPYLINLDSIYAGTVLASAAGGFEAIISKHYQIMPAPADTSLVQLRMGGLKGGHSGEDIAKGRGSTAELACRIMGNLASRNIKFGIAKLKAGSAMNAISTTMKIILVVENAHVGDAIQIMGEAVTYAKENFKESAGTDFDIEVKPTYGCMTMSNVDSVNVYEVVSQIPNGPIKMMDNGRPETSCNLGIFDVREGLLKANLLFRSCVKDELKAAHSKMDELADIAHGDMIIRAIFPAWNRQDHNPLSDLFLKSYTEVCGFEGEAIDIHSGLECGYFSDKKPEIFMTSVGCDLKNEHTPKETLYTKSMPAFMASLLYVLKHINSAC